MFSIDVVASAPDDQSLQIVFHVPMCGLQLPPVEGVGGEVTGGQLAGEWVPLMVAP